MVRLLRQIETLGHVSKSVEQVHHRSDGSDRDRRSENRQPTPSLNGTYDKPIHIACGMEWLQWGTYTCDPSILRWPVLLWPGPFLKGLSPRGAGRRTRPADKISPKRAMRSLCGGRLLGQFDFGAARYASFFGVAVRLSTFLWARRWFCRGFSAAAGFWAVLLLVCTSPILGHAGLATNDVACAAGAVLALYQFLRWLEEPQTVRWLWWGFATAFATLCKFSNIPFWRRATRLASWSSEEIFDADSRKSNLRHA